MDWHRMLINSIDLNIYSVEQFRIELYNQDKNNLKIMLSGKI